MGTDELAAVRMHAAIRQISISCINCTSMQILPNMWCAKHPQDPMPEQTFLENTYCDQWTPEP